MIYFLDTADLAAIKHAAEFYPIAGVTTNPSLIAKTGADFRGLLADIRAVIGRDKLIHVQTTATEAKKIVAEAKLLESCVGGDFCLKIPISEEGLKATMMLCEIGIKVTTTAIFTPAQALMAARAGSSYVAVFVNRLDSIIGDGAGVVAEIVEQFKANDLDCRVIAASFKNAEQVHRCALAGAHCATVAPDILRSLIAHPMTDAAVDIFRRDWAAVYGDRTIGDLV